MEMLVTPLERLKKELYLLVVNKPHAEIPTDVANVKQLFETRVHP